MVIGRVRQAAIPCSVNTTKCYLGGFVSGHYGEVVFKTGLTVFICPTNVKRPKLFKGSPPEPPPGPHHEPVKELAAS